MSGFSTDWLALREPADRAARNRGLLGCVATFISAAKPLTILDLGAGTGSTLRAVAPVLRTAQSWVLVDDDGSLATAGARLLAAWAAESQAHGDDFRNAARDLNRDHDPLGEAPRAAADAAASAPPSAPETPCDRNDLPLHGYRSTQRVGGVPVDVCWRSADLSTVNMGALIAGADLVTASALFDLVSDGFVESFADAVATAGSAVYVALDVDGTAAWSPPHPDDEAVAAAFRRHQATDKGFGAALGPRATGVLARALTARGYAVRTAPSPWRLGAEHPALIAALADGWANAAREAGLDADAAERWRLARGSATGCIIGHTDLFATPPGP
jgi:hypothetical protein